MGFRVPELISLTSRSDSFISRAFTSQARALTTSNCNPRFRADPTKLHNLTLPPHRLLVPLILNFILSRSLPVFQSTTSSASYIASSIKLHSSDHLKLTHHNPKPHSNSTQSPCPHHAPSPSTPCACSQPAPVKPATST